MAGPFTGGCYKPGSWLSPTTIERPPLHFRRPRTLHPSCQRGRRVAPKPSDGRRGVCAGLASRQELRQLLHAAKNQGDQLEIPAVAWRQGNQTDGQGPTRNLTQGRRADSGRDKRPEIQFDGNLCARFQVILWSAVSQHLRKSSAFSTQHGCLMAVGSTANAPIATAPKATPSTAAATTAVVSSLCFIAPPSSILSLARI